MENSTENNYQETDLGNVSPNPRGEYDSTAEYEYLDLVSYKGGSYLCTVELGETVTNVSPAAGKNTDIWQLLTLPGALTAEYVAMHDDVVNKAKQVESSRAAVEQSQQEIEAAQTDMRQLHSDTAQAAQQATDSRDSAAGYASVAEQSRRAVKESEENVNAQISNFDTHVAEKTQESELAITDARQQAVQTITKQQELSVQAVKDETAEYIEEQKNTAKEEISSRADEKIEEMKQAGKPLDASVEEAKKINSQLVTNNQSAESAEKKRIAAENSRKEAETKRASAETERKQAEEQRVQETQQAITNANKATEAAQAVADNVSGIIDEKILEAFFGSMRTGKVYQTEFYLTATNPTSAGTKTLANEEKVCEPSTDTVEGRDDYEGIGIFNWYNCNYITDDYGRKVPTAIEGWGNSFKNDGSVDVGVIAMTPYWSAVEKDGKQIWTLSDTPNDDYGLIPWETARKEDGTYASYVVHSKYISGLGKDGLLRSFFNSKPFRNNCYNNMIDNYQKKGKACWGAGKERDMYVILHVVIKYATKNEQKIFRGTTSYDLQFSASIQRDMKETYFPLTNSQASQIIVGSYVSVGYGSANGTSVNNDRGVETIHNYADDVKVLRIEDIDENNKAVYLDIEEGFTTTPVALSDTLNAPITLSTMHWWSGSTDKVIGKHDGSMGSNTDGKHPFRVMGLECSVGGYIVYSDSVMVFKEDYSKDVYIAPRCVKHAKDEATIKSTYKLIGNMPGNDGVDWWIGDIGVDMETCSWFAKTVGNSDSQGWGDRCYSGGKVVPGTREDLGRGALWSGASGGPVFVACRTGLGGAGWGCLGCD